MSKRKPIDILNGTRVRQTKLKKQKKNSWSYLWALAPVRTCAVCKPCQWYQHRSRIPTRCSAIILICWRARGCDDSMTRLTHHQFNSCNAIHSAQVAGSSISSNHHVSIDWLHGDARPTTESCKRNTAHLPIIVCCWCSGYHRLLTFWY